MGKKKYFEYCTVNVEMCDIIILKMVWFLIWNLILSPWPCTQFRELPAFSKFFLYLLGKYLVNVTFKIKALIFTQVKLSMHGHSMYTCIVQCI